MDEKSLAIKTEIEAKFGFFPPFFGPALATPSVLESLWRHTVSDYLDNPIPHLFKEKLAAMLGRYCMVPYCLMCHSAALSPLGMKPVEVLELLETAPLTYDELGAEINALGTARICGWPKENSPTENAILACCVAIFLNQDAEVCQRKLKLVLEPSYYQYLTIFISYNKVALNWAEMHPELSYQDDKRVQDHLAPLIAGEQRLADFFSNYQGRSLAQSNRKNQWLSAENKRILEDERSRLNSYFAQAPVGFAVVEEPDHIVVMANAKYEALVGKTAFQGKAIRDVLNENEVPELFNLLDGAYASGKGFVLRDRAISDHANFNSKTGEIFINITVEPYRNEHGAIAGLFIILNEVTEEVRARQDQVRFAAELNEAKADAERANNSKSAFLANMSHEIRSPLGSIMGFADLLKSTDLSRQDINQYISVIDRNSNHLLRIIDDILDLAKVEAGKMLIESVEFSLHELLADFTSLIGFRARDKGIDFQLRVPGLIPSTIISDPTRIRQILTNIVGNAIKFTERGSVQLLVTFNSNEIQFLVSDTGPGISAEQVDQLFQPFQQADASTTRRFGGTGLGLVLTRKLSEALGGTFKLIRSQLGQGSTFAATIRADVPATASLIDSSKALGYLEQPRSESIAQTKLLSGRKVLVVDDSPDNQILFQLILAKAGALIDIAIDGFDGVNMALTKSYDVILMDVQMPRMDGHQATKELRAKGCIIPIIALTAHAMNEEKERAAESGFTDFLSKPVHRDELLDLLKSLIG